MTPSNTPTLTDDSLSSILSLIVVLNAAVLAQTLLYGIHIVLFLICLYILIVHRHTAPWYSLTSALLMFALSTADIALTIRLCVHNLPELYLPGGTDYLSTRLYPKNPFFVANNFLATLYLLHRCYMVWDRTRFALIGLGFLLLLDTVWGFLAFASPVFFDEHKIVPVYVWTIFSLNVVITAIIVGRIFWVSRWARPWVDERQMTKYHVAIAILMESSVIYSACLLGYILYPPRSDYRVVVISLCMRLVSIMPTLLIVQVGLARMNKGSSGNGISQATWTMTEHRGDEGIGTLPGGPHGAGTGIIGHGTVVVGGGHGHGGPHMTHTGSHPLHHHHRRSFAVPPSPSSFPEYDVDGMPIERPDRRMSISSSKRSSLDASTVVSFRNGM